MDKPKCKLCGERHRLGPCTETLIVRAVIPKPKRGQGGLKVGDKITVSAGLLPKPQQFAPAGECVYCDHRRAKVAEAVRLHRAKARKITE